MALTRQFLIVADNPGLTPSLEAHWRKNASRPPPLTRFEAARDRLVPGAGGLLVLGTASAEDSRQVADLVREIALHDWPVNVFIAETEGARQAQDLSFL